MSAVPDDGEAVAAVPHGRLRGWADAQLYGLWSSLGRIGHRPGSTALTAGVMAIALALPLCLLLLLAEVERFSGSLAESREITVFLDPELAGETAEAHAQRLRADPRVAQVVVRSPGDGLAELQQMRDFDGALEVLDRNPLPFVLVVAPQPAADDAALAAELGALPDSDFVQHDAQWRQRLSAWLELGRRFTAVAAGLLGLGVLLVVGNTVRLDIQGRAEEIATLRLLGATDAFIRRPFVYLGAWYGALAGLLALGLTLAARAALADPLTALVASYGSGFGLAPVAWTVVAGVLAIAMALGVVGAWLAVGRHLRQAEGEA